ncbi:MAG: exonuclease SbcCD subunit D [Muribaculaceae bacterium]|nr:exonuclease SbcCD subunit D [Muribaculaceae bacterium]
MKVLHTSDWHLGHSIYHYDRSKEQRDMLRQIQEIAIDEQPDVLLVSGDVFHTSQPSTAVQTMFTEAIISLHTACPAMHIVVTAGNHDSGSRHEVFRTPWLAFNVHMIGSIDKDDLDQCIIDIDGKGYVIAVPYAHERNIPDGYFQALLDRTAQLNTQERPVVMSAHLTVGGSDFTGHNNASEYSAGGIDAYSPEALGEGYDYMALGHIHHAQFIRGSEKRMRYSGTPLAVSFDEAYAHSVSIVDIEAHGDAPQVHTIEIENPRPLVTLPATGTATWDEAQQLLADYPDDINSYIRLNVVTDSFLPPDANEVATSLTQGKLCTFCLINTTRHPGKNDEAHEALTVDEFESMPPVEIARRYAQSCDVNFDDEMAQLFSEVLMQVNEDQRNQ